MFDQVMCDLETMGMPPDGAVVSIGACFFDMKNEVIGPTFEQTIHLGSAVEAGGTISPGTVMFWLGQPDQARKAIRFGGRQIAVVLTEFSDWIAETCRHEDVYMWGNSPSFDQQMLGGAYDRLGIKRPWYWSRERDFRTVRGLFPKVEYDTSTMGDDAHTALADAIFQTEHIFKIKRYRRGERV